MRAAYLVSLLLASVASKDPDVGKGMEAIVAARGYGAYLTSHNVTTGDGYILTMFRLNRRPASSPGPPVLLQHALLCSSFDWVNNYANQSLAFVLADAGYDVWLGNNRGNQWGAAHTTLAPTSEAFWDFSWDEMALYDLPALASHALAASGHPSRRIAIVGHSEGTTQTFAALSRNDILPGAAAPDFSWKRNVSLFVALAPVALVQHQRSPVFGLLADLGLPGLIKLLGAREFLPSGSVLNKIAPSLCSLLPSGCDVAIFLFCGPTKHVNASRIDVYTAKTPAGTSVRNMMHWAQMTRRTATALRMFDYGSARKNRAHYNASTPPEYKLADVGVPVALFAGDQDWLADAADVARLQQLLPSATVVSTETLAGYAHLDFSWGLDAARHVYPRLVELLNASFSS